MFAEFPEVHYRLATLLAAETKWGQAILHFTKAIELDGDLADAYLGRGMVFLKIDLPDAAITDLTAAIRINPDIHRAHSQRTGLPPPGQIHRDDRGRPGGDHARGGRSRCLSYARAGVLKTSGQSPERTHSYFNKAINLTADPVTKATLIANIRARSAGPMPTVASRCARRGKSFQRLSSTSTKC